MNVELIQRAQAIFEHLTELDHTEVQAYITAKCAGDVALSQAVLSLLKNHQQLSEEQTITIECHIMNLLSTQSETESVGHVDLTLNSERYELIKKLGDGGMGAVYLCHRLHDGFKQQVAIKVLRGLDAKSDAIQRFIQEKHILAQLKHPNITSFIDTDYLADGTPFVVMEFTPGLSLTAYVEERQPKIEQKLALFKQLCAAVTHAHQNLIIHRDIKPSNVMVTEQGQVKLIDFGIAKVLSSEIAMLTQTGVGVMTPAYASPEQLLKQPLNTSTDIYSLGVVLYELLTGTRPHNLKDLSMGQYEQLLLKGDFELPSQRAKLQGELIHPDLDAIITKAMQANPTQRYQSVKEFTDDIDRHLANRPVLARKPNFIYKTTKFIRRNWISLSAAAAVAMVSGLFLYQIQQANVITVQEQQKARILSESFIMAFKNADPTQTLGEEIKATDILDQAQNLIAQQYANQPQLLNDLSYTMAEVYKNIGSYEVATQIVDLAMSESDQMDPDLLADWLLLKANILEVTEEADLLITTLSSLQPVTAEQKLAKQILQVLAYSKKGQADDAIMVVNQLMQSIQPSDARYTEVCLMYFGLHHHEKEFAAQEAMLDECLIESADDERLLENNQVYKNYAVLYRDQGKFEKSNEYFKKTLEIDQKIYGDMHISQVNAYKWLGWNFMQQEKYEQSIELQNKALAITENYFGQGHPNTSNAIFNLGHVYSNMENYDQAFAQYNLAIKIMEDHGLGQERKMGFFYKSIGHLQNDLGMYDEAEQNIRKSIQVFDLLQGLFIYRVAEMQVLLAHIHQNQGRDAEARALIDQALPNMYTMHKKGEYYRELAEQLDRELKPSET